MDAYEATRIVFSRIQSLDPENASKIMGLLLIQDHGEKEMIRLAFGPEAVVHSVVLKARKDLGLGLSSNTSSAPLSPSSNSISRQNSFSSSSSRLINGSLNFHSSSSWAPSSFSDLHNPDDLVSPNSTSSAYAAAVNGFNNTVIGSLSSSESASSASLFYGSNSDLIDEFQIQDQLSFLNDSSTNLGPKNSDLFYPQQESSYTGANWGGSINGQQHRRSCSVTDICMGSDTGSGFGWKPCLYFARGYCKNGTSCRFLHGLPDTAAAAVGDAAAAAIVGSPGKLDVIEQCHELLRSKNSTQQRLDTASQLMASASFPYSSAAGKCMNFLLQQQQQQNDTQRVAAAAAALMMGEDIHKFGHSRLERNEFSTTGMVNPGSRQIYLTFPADSTFREEDVSNYFSIYGPVQDVRIPYQQKRMFGFVTFVYPETVKLILAKGNPHFVCDARVLVKPYKEKGKVPDKYRKQQQQQQQAERGDFSPCTTPSGLDSRDTYDLQLGARMFYNTQDVLMRRKLEEQADLQQAIELHGRRLIGLQLLDVKKQQHHRNLSAGASIPSPSYSPMNQNLIIPSDLNGLETSPENYVSRATTSSTVAAADEQVQQAVKAQEVSFINDNGKEKIPSNEDSVDHNLPDSPFASPTKSAGDHLSIFTNAVTEETERSAQALPSSSSPPSSNTNNNNNIITPSLLPASSTLDVASLKSCYFQMPRFSSGHGAIEM